MAVNIILGIVTLVSSIKAVSFGVWTLKNGNISGAISVIAVTVAVMAVVTVYLAYEYGIIR